MSKLTIENYTQWSTSSIREAVRAAERHFELKWDRKVIVKYARRCGMRGRGAYPHDRRVMGRLVRGYKGNAEGTRLKLYLPTEPPADPDQLVRDFLWLVLHEVGHNAGLSHRDMGVTSALNVVWDQKEKPLSMGELGLLWEGVEKPTPAAARATMLTARSDKAAADLARWEAELARRESLVKRAKKKLTELRARVRYYERRAEGTPEPLTSIAPAATMSDEPHLMAAKEPTR